MSLGGPGGVCHESRSLSFEALSGSDFSYTPSSTATSSSLDGSQHLAEDVNRRQGTEVDACSPSQATSPLIKLPYTISNKTQVVSVGTVHQNPAWFNCHLNMFIPVDYNAVARIGGHEYELTTLRMAYSDKPFFQVKDTADAGRVHIAQTASAACRFAAPDSKYSGPELFGFNDKWVRQAIKGTYPEGAHTLATQLVTAKMQKDQRKQKASRNKPAAKRTGGSVSDRKQHQASKFGHICRSSPVEGFTGGPAEAQAQVSKKRRKHLCLTKLKARVLSQVQAAAQSDADKAAFETANEKDTLLKKTMIEVEKLSPDVRARLDIEESIAAEQAACAAAESNSLAFAMHKQIGGIFDDVIKSAGHEQVPV